MSNECKYGVSLNLHYPGGCFNCEIDRLQAEIERMKPVIEAAKAWESKSPEPDKDWDQIIINLEDAVRALKESEAKDE